MKKIYWTMKTGEKVDIDEMSINHLKNTLKMIVRNIEKLEEKKKKEINLEGNIEQAFYEAMVEAEMREMGYSDENDYEYYLKTRGK